VSGEKDAHGCRVPSYLDRAETLLSLGMGVKKDTDAETST